MPEFVAPVVEQLGALLPQLVSALAIFLAFWFLALATRALLGRFAGKRDMATQNIFRLVRQVVYIGLLLLGLVTALGTVGVNVAALVTSLGLAGFALGFALKDALSNLISGVMLLLYRPFRVGDTVSATGYQGKVIAIDLRYTTLQLEGKVVFIPNSKLFTESVVLMEEKDESVASGK
jgi:small-conductance mechanosensitive channel